MSKENNLTDFLTDVADAIREKKGTAEKINPQNFSDEIKGIKTSMWTGHVDVEGLKAIGWDDEDIAYFQEHGVNWMEEDDEYYKVSDDNKALYGVLTVDNIKEYKDRIVWLPKIDLSGRANIIELFMGFDKMIGVPMLDISMYSSCAGLFRVCSMLRTIPKLNTSHIFNFGNLCYGCGSLVYVPELDISSSASCIQAFFYCGSLLKGLESISVQKCSYIYSGCSSMVDAGCFDFQNTKEYGDPFQSCLRISNLKIRNLHVNISLGNLNLLSKPSMLYIINNEAATEAITITLHANAYARLSTDHDIVAALENHPLVSLASV